MVSMMEKQLIPARYKQTEVGVIPEDWNVDKIDNVLSITTGSRNTQDKVPDGLYPFYVRSQTVECINSFSFDGEGVLTAGDGVGTGKIFHYINGKCDIHQRVYLMHNFSKKLNGYYFYIYFKNNFYDKVMSMTAKSSVDSVRREMIADMLISLPSLIEQTSIANALSDVDALIAALEKLINKKSAIKTAAMQQLLTGKKRLPPFDQINSGYKQTELGEIPGDWGVGNLPQYVWYQEGPGLRNWQFTTKGIKVINVTNLQYSGFLDLDKTDRHISIELYEKMYRHFECDAGDFVMASSGNSYAKSSIVREIDLPLLMNTSVIRFKAKENIESSYMQAYLKSEFFKSQIDLMITGGAQPNFGPFHLNKISLPIPSTLEEQTAIANMLSDMDKDLEVLQQQLHKTQQIKQGMMQELLTGKTRLVKPQGDAIA